MPDRFYLDAPWDARVVLSDAESQHLRKVLRKQVGDQVELFDGKGLRASATVASIKKRSVELEVNTAPAQVSQSPFDLTIAVAPPKGDRLRWLVEKMTELGVARLVLLNTERSVVQPGDAKIQKLNQTMISACKQSRRDQFLEIAPVQNLDDFLEQDNHPPARFYGAIPNGEETEPSPQKQVTAESATLCIGPEGGLSREEILKLETWGARPLTVSPHILRVETAAIAAASYLLACSLRQS